MDPKKFIKEQNNDEEGDEIIQNDNIDRVNGNQGRRSVKPEDTVIASTSEAGSERPDTQKIPLV